MCVTQWPSVEDDDKAVKWNGCLCIMTILYMCVYETICYEQQHCTLRFSNHISHYSCLFTRFIPLQKNKHLYSLSLQKLDLAQTWAWCRCLRCWHIMSKKVKRIYPLEAINTTSVISASLWMQLACYCLFSVVSVLWLIVYMVFSVRHKITHYS